MKNVDDLLAAIGAARQANLRLYSLMAELVDAAALGWRPREPGADDVTLALIGAALQERPDLARPLLAAIAENDAEVVRLTRELAHG